MMIKLTDDETIGSCKSDEDSSLSGIATFLRLKICGMNLKITSVLVALNKI